MNAAEAVALDGAAGRTHRHRQPQARGGLIG